MNTHRGMAGVYVWGLTMGGMLVGLALAYELWWAFAVCFGLAAFTFVNALQFFTRGESK